MLIDTKAFFKSLIVLSLSLNFVACSDTSEEAHQIQAQQSAQELVDKQNNLVSSINFMGTPKSSWSESKISDYENKLDELERIERQLDIVNGGNGITITGGQNADFISERRALIRRLRSQSNPRREQPTIRPPSDDQENKQIDARVNSLLDQAEAKNNIIQAQDFISQSLTDAELQERAELLSEQETILREIKTLNDRRIRDQNRAVGRSSGAMRELQELLLDIYHLNEARRALHNLTLELVKLELLQEIDRRESLPPAPTPPAPFFRGGR